MISLNLRKGKLIHHQGELYISEVSKVIKIEEYGMLETTKDANKINIFRKILAEKVPGWLAHGQIMQARPETWPSM